MDLLLNEEVSSEMKKDLRHAYLRESGITGKLNEIFSKMLQTSPKPEYPLDFIREELGDKPIPAEHIERMEHELDDAHREIRRLRDILKKLGIENVDVQYDDMELGPDEYESVAVEFRNSTPNATVVSVEEQK